MKRNHEETFFHLDILLDEFLKLTIPKDHYKMLNKMNQYFIRGVLLSIQFDKKDKETKYECLQKLFVEKYEYDVSKIDKLTLQVKEISTNTPDYINVKGESINLFIDTHK